MMKYSFIKINNKTYSVYSNSLDKSVGLLVWADNQLIWTYIAHHDTPHSAELLIHICRFIVKLNSKKSEYSLAN